MNQINRIIEEDSQPIAPSGARLPRNYTIGDLSREFDISLRTLRFYEDRGLIQPERRGNTRFYSAGDRVRLQIILKGKKLGFTLAEIDDMLKADASVEESGLQLNLDAKQIESQIDYLERQRSDLDQAIAELRATYSRVAGTRAA